MYLLCYSYLIFEFLNVKKHNLNVILIIKLKLFHFNFQVYKCKWGGEVVFITLYLEMVYVRFKLRQ